MKKGGVHLLANYLEYVFKPRTRYPKSWAPAFTAIQLGFIAGGIGLVGRDALLFFTLQNWHLVIFAELCFASIIALGFLLHTLGYAQVGVVISCLAGVGSATAFITLLGWDSMFHLWYINLAILLIAVPIRISLKTALAGLIILLYGGMFFNFSSQDGYVNVPYLTGNLLGLSNIFGTPLVLGIPMGMYSKFLVQERETSERLLHNIMPKQIAEILKNSSEPVALENPDISVMMADIVNFTSFSDNVSAEKVVKLLNGIFSRFDEVVLEHNVEKIKTIGDAYMVVAGLPEARADHAQILVDMSTKFIEIASEYNDHEGNPIQIRIGIHSGPAVSGVIGKSKFAFDVWGDTINTAARLESNGEPGKIHLSQRTFDMLDKNSSFNVRSQSISMKGKGAMQTVLIGQAVRQ